MAEKKTITVEQLRKLAQTESKKYDSRIGRDDFLDGTDFIINIIDALNKWDNGGFEVCARHKTILDTGQYYKCKDCDSHWPYDQFNDMKERCDNVFTIEKSDNYQG